MSSEPNYVERKISHPDTGYVDMDSVHEPSSIQGNIRIGKTKPKGHPKVSITGFRFPKTNVQAEKNISKAAYKGKRKPSLVIYFYQPSPKMFEAYLGKRVVIRVIGFGGRWKAIAKFGRQKLFEVTKHTAKEAVAALCGQNWFWYEDRAEWWSLYDLYRTVNWQGLSSREQPLPIEFVTQLSAHHCKGRWIFMPNRKALKVRLIKAVRGITKVMPDKRNEMAFASNTDTFDPSSEYIPINPEKQFVPRRIKAKNLRTKKLEAGDRETPKGKVYFPNSRIIPAPPNAKGGIIKLNYVPKGDSQLDDYSGGLRELARPTTDAGKRGNLL